MITTIEVIPFDPVDLERCKEAGLDEEQARQVVLLCAEFAVDVSRVLAMLSTAAKSAGTAIAKMGEAAVQPDFRFDLSNDVYLNRADRRMNEQRLRSMRKPTGKPWDRRPGR